MSANLFKELECNVNAIFNMKSELLNYLECLCETAPSNTSATIDSKIEQAMDLVKSHLMYAVREEVEVLKVRITELLDRINQLEMENSFLKANATPEVLNALRNRPGTQVQTKNVTTGGAPNTGGPSPTQ